MSKTIIGTCGRCGGPVCAPTTFLSTVPPDPACERCGAKPRNAYGPRMEMQSTYFDHSRARFNAKRGDDDEDASAK